jgi:hypothetical protein
VGRLTWHIFNPVTSPNHFYNNPVTRGRHLRAYCLHFTGEKTESERQQLQSPRADTGSSFFFFHSTHWGLNSGLDRHSYILTHQLLGVSLWHKTWKAGSPPFICQIDTWWLREAGTVNQWQDWDENPASSGPGTMCSPCMEDHRASPLHLQNPLPLSAQGLLLLLWLPSDAVPWGLLRPFSQLVLKDSRVLMNLSTGWFLEKQFSPLFHPRVPATTKRVRH